MSDVSKSEEGYVDSSYYKSIGWKKDLQLTYKVNLNFDKFKMERFTELYLIHRSIREEKMLYDENYYSCLTNIEVIIETLDGYSVIIDGSKDYTSPPYIKYKKEEDIIVLLPFNEEWFSQDEDKKDTTKGETLTMDEINERTKQNKFKIITDARNKKYSNDSSYKNVYYQFDYGTDTITKYEAKYKDSKRHEYVRKVYKKEIDGDISFVLKKTLNNLITKKDVKEDDNDSFYVIESAEKEKNIYNKDSIKLLKKMIEIIDNA